MIHILSLLYLPIMPSPDVLFIMWTYWINPLIWEKLFLLLSVIIKYIKWIHLVPFKHNENFRSNFVPSGWKVEKFFPSRTVFCGEQRNVCSCLYGLILMLQTHTDICERKLGSKQHEQQWFHSEAVVLCCSCQVKSADEFEKDPLHYDSA